jgi:hypothetical protein
MQDANKLNHLFGNPRHNLDGLARQFGSREAAGRAIMDAVNQGFAAGSVSTDDHGFFRQVFVVAGNRVTVTGRIVDGEPRIGSAWRPV